MENYAIEQNFDDELQHWGIKGQKWGQRRYQNKDGSLTPAGQKRYNKEVEKLKKEKAKVKAEEKVQANKKKTQAKIDKLEAEKQALADRKKALKEEQSGGKKTRGKNKKDSAPEETFEQRREKALKTSDPNELYKNKDTLSDNELRERINRINMERQLAQTAASTQKTGMDRINKALEYAKKGDEIYKFVNNSQVGKDLMKAVGLKNEKVKEFDLDKFYNNMHKMSDSEREQGVKIAKQMFTTKAIKESFDKAKKEADDAAAAKKAEADKKVYDDFHDNLRREQEAAEKEASRIAREAAGEGSTYRTNGVDLTDSRTYTRNATLLLEGPVGNTPLDNAPAVVTDRGRSAVDEWMEKYGRR